MEPLQLMKFSICKARPLKFTEELNWSDKLKEFEHAAWAAAVGDPEAYGWSLDNEGEDSDEMEEALDNLQKDLEALEEVILEGDEDNDEDDDMSMYI